MISGSAARTNSDNITGSLSYINNLVTGATTSGSYQITVSNQYMNETMATQLRSIYGFNVTTRNDFNRTNNEYIISWGTNTIVTPLPTATPTATPVPTATPTPTPVALDFTIGSYCEQSPKMLSITVRSIIGGSTTGGYQISKTTFSSQADAEANTDWITLVDSDIITTPINGTYWVSVKDSLGTIKAKSVSVTCFPTPTPTPTHTPTPTPIPTSTPAPTATVGPTPTPTSLYQSYNYSISATDLAAATGNTGGNVAYNNKVVVVLTNGYNCANTTVRNFTYSFNAAGSSYISWLISLKTNVPVLGYYKDNVLVTTGLISTQTANPSVPC